MTALPRSLAEQPGAPWIQRAVERAASGCQGETGVCVCGGEITCFGRAPSWPPLTGLLTVAR